MEYVTNLSYVYFITTNKYDEEKSNSILCTRVQVV